MSVYVPSTASRSSAIVVALHTCGGSMQQAQGWFQTLADKYGFLIIAGQSAGGCWDAAVGRNGERATIVQAVNYVLQNYPSDKTRVFSAGASSGACMTQALLASYPEIFAAGSSLAAVPAGAWTGGGNYGWSAPSSMTAQQWGDKVRQADPGFTGDRPRIQLWQGQGDTNLTYSVAYPAEIAQWTNVFAVTSADATMSSIKPSGATDTWQRTSYKDSSGIVVLEANSGPTNVPHDLTPRGLWSDVVRFFGLDGSTPPVTRDGGMAAGGANGDAGRDDGGAAGAGMDAAISGTGGTPAGTGGVTASGGTIGSGGARGDGVTGQGGAVATGGDSSGGASGSGGVAVTGSSTGHDSGGASASGGAGGTTRGSGSGGVGADSVSGGHGCSFVAGDSPALPLTVVLLFLGFVSAVCRSRGRGRIR
jgi:poly(hydroxyalkanoate) depolymerase family esterase